MHDSSLLLALRLFGSLAVVVAVMAGVARLARRRGLAVPGRRAPIAVLARQPLAKSAFVAVVRVSGRDLLVGVTPQSVTLLTESDHSLLPDPEQAQEQEAGHRTWPGAGKPPGSAWTTLLDQLREMTVRRQ